MEAKITRPYALFEPMCCRLHRIIITDVTSAFANGISVFGQSVKQASSVIYSSVLYISASTEVGFKRIGHYW